MGWFSVFSSAQENSSSPAGQLYLVAAVNMEFGVDNPGSPVVLYQIGDAKKLKRAREVTSGHKSGSIITSEQDAIFVTYPSLSPTTVSVLHFSEPLLKDEIAINPKHLNADTGIMVTADTSASTHSLLLPLITINPNRPGSGRTLLSIRSNIEGDGPRIRLDAWDDYSMLRFEGFQGGSGSAPYPEARIAGDQFFLAGVEDAVPHPASIASPPPELKALGKKAVPDILASSNRYLILYLQPTIGELNSRNVGDSMKLYVLHRDSHRWETTEAEGVGGVRLFGPWLADNVALWNSPRNAKAARKAGRGDGSERDPMAQSGNVEGTEDYVFPGILVLQNLEDGRKLRILTDHADSEILYADDATVLYRVENAIYQAALAKDTVQSATLLIQDTDVPKIHWVFWSK